MSPCSISMVLLNFLETQRRVGKIEGGRKKEGRLEEKEKEGREEREEWKEVKERKAEEGWRNNYEWC